ncbi:MAG: protein-L-isoaspartate O-methyltransferase [Chloroflexi bacterium CG07_land_8_20_14_0_80_51_10]|nr:MAG: protein-L-isoaspartate O-methyltransferase [Chloroflexi bacterium CG07_land_8_20_14_0_80_51_10]
MNDNRDLDADRARLIRHLRQEISNDRVIRAMERVPRELFVPPPSQHLAYEDIPLPIEMGQTISQPFIVALMTDALELSGQERVLEVGTGSGYQAAILAELAHLVISVERHQRLIELASRTLNSLGYRNIEIHLAGEILGWREGAPYDRIIVTAGAPQVPQELLDQLAEGGRLVIPVGSRYEQQLLKATKRKGRITTQDLGGCRFVPLIAKGAWKEDENIVPVHRDQGMEKKG